jgi:hypothetical protein
VDLPILRIIEDYAPVSDHNQLKSRIFMSRLSLLSWVSSLGWSGHIYRTPLVSGVVCCPGPLCKS